MDRLQEIFTDKRDGVEVKSINSYVVSMGYLSMAIKGLGFLVLTWTTVVLFGGFITILHKKDFWSLTFITLAQTAGIFDVNMNEKVGYMKNAYIGLFKAIKLGVLGVPRGLGCIAICCLAPLTLILMSVQAVLLVMILVPLSFIYVFGIFMSRVISLWRLIKHDYGGNSDGEASNLAPAMNTLYYLALLQGVLLCYRFVLGRVGKKLCRHVAGEDRGVKLVLQDYLRETKRGCEKKPVFVEGRNLITYAVDKISSNSPTDYVYGVNIMHTAICMADKGNELYLMKHLFLSTLSSQYVLQNLLEMLGSTGLHNRETRSQATTIVEQLALYINLEQFPRGIEHISYLLQTSKLGETYMYKELLLQGMSILRNLAANEKNCRVMSNTPDLVSKIMAPITFDLLDHTADDYGTCYTVVHRSMEVISQLTNAQGETGAKIRHEISSCKEAIHTLWRILSYEKCGEWLQQKAISILTRLYMDTIGISRSTHSDLLKKGNNCCGEDFVRMLVNIFTHGNGYRSSIRGYAGEPLSEISFFGGISNATIVIQASDDVVDRLTQVHFGDENETSRKAAAEILEHLCTHYTIDDEYLGKLKKSIIMVVGQIVLYVSSLQPEDVIESQCDGTQENNKQNEEKGLQTDTPLSIIPTNFITSLLSLCGTVYDTSFVIDLPPQVDASAFLTKLKEIVERKSNPTVENLSLCKATVKMVISMMKYYNGGFFKQEDCGSLIEALSSASKNMLDLDYTVVCFSASSSDTRSKFYVRTLASFVREAKELHVKAPSTSLSG